jgi:hypothetical protein
MPPNGGANMRAAGVWIVSVILVLGVTVAYGDHPYSVGGSGKSYYSERDTPDATGYRPYIRPERYSDDRWDGRHDSDHWRYSPAGGYTYYYGRPTLFEYSPTLFGRDSLGPYGRPLTGYLEVVPIPSAYWDYDWYRPCPPYGHAYGYRHRHGDGLDAILRLGAGKTGLTIIISP